MSPVAEAALGFSDRLALAARAKETPVVLGLDPRPELFPRGMRPRGAKAKEVARKILAFNKKAIDLAVPHACAVKPQIAFYERWGAPGWEAYEETIAHAHDRKLLAIGDAKRGDVGSTAEAYAEAHLGKGPKYADALTVNPLFGSDGMEPFLRLARERGRGLFVLVRTSNPGASELQEARAADGETWSEKAASLVARWGADSIGRCGYSAVGAVVGATQPEAIASLRRKLPRAWLLLPGYGAQGADAKGLAPAFDREGLGALVAASRLVLYAYLEPRWAGGRSWEEACVRALLAMKEDLRRARGG